MHENLDYDPYENMTWEEQLELMDNQQLIEYILHLERLLLDYESKVDELPW